MKQYETKKLDATWLNSIPSYWLSLKFKKLFEEINIKNYPQLQLLVASQNMGVVPKNIYGKRTVEAQKDLDKLKLVMPDNFVISLRSFQGGIEYSTYMGIISPAYTILKQKYKNNSLYFKYLFKSFPFIKLLQLCVTGIREGQNIDYDMLKEHLIPVPPREEQDKIVAYLDYQTSNINKLILSKRKQIELLEEYKKTKISEVVTKGLNPNAEMKESDIDWIGQIPKHWEVKRLKEVGVFIHEKYGKNDNILKYIALENIISFSGKLVHTDNNYNISQSIICKKNDILFGKLRPYLAKIYICENKVCCSQEFSVFRAINIFYKYTFFIYISQIFIDLVDSSTYGTKMPRVNNNFIQNIYIPIPPQDEQKEIAAYLDNLIFKLDNLISKHKLYIEKLEEYKKTLISDVVTGKIDVRDIDIPEYEKVDITEEI